MRWMSHGSNWISNTKLANISIGGNQLVLNSKEQSGSIPGYFKIQNKTVKSQKDLASIKVSNSNNHVVWGALIGNISRISIKLSDDVSKSFSISRDLFVESGRWQ